jgi:hypothetical protein
VTGAPPPLCRHGCQWVIISPAEGGQKTLASFALLFVFCCFLLHFFRYCGGGGFEKSPPPRRGWASAIVGGLNGAWVVFLKSAPPHHLGQLWPTRPVLVSTQVAPLEVPSQTGEQPTSWRSVLTIAMHSSRYPPRHPRLL